eukprot:551646_1
MTAINQYLFNPEIQKSIFDPNYKIATIDANAEELIPSPEHSVRSMPINNRPNITITAPQNIPYHHNAEYQIMTPPATNSNGNHATFDFTQQQSLPNTPFGTIGSIKNDDTTPQLPMGTLSEPMGMQQDANQRRFSAPTLPNNALPETPIFDITALPSDALNALFQTEPINTNYKKDETNDTNTSNKKKSSQNKSDEDNDKSIENISPKQSSSPNNKQSSSDMMISNDQSNQVQQLSDINISNVDSYRNIKFHAPDPNAEPCSPPIASVYKPITSTFVSSGRLSYITESTAGGSSNESTPHPQRNRSHSNNKSTTPIPENNIMLTSSNESMQFQQIIHGNDLAEINTNFDNIDVDKKAFQDPTSSPSDDDDLVAKQWMDLHHAAGGVIVKNDHDTTLNPIYSMHSEISSDNDENEVQVKEWKRTMANMAKMDVLTNSKLDDSNIDSENANTSNDDKIPLQSSDDDINNNILSNNQFTEMSSKYSSSTMPTTSDDDEIVLNNMSSSMNKDKRHSQLLRRQSIPKWSAQELCTEQDDMEKELKHLETQFESKNGLIKDPQA